MASNPDPVRVTISQPADGSDGLNPNNVVVQGTTSVDYATCRKAVARDVFGREFQGSLTQRPDGVSWSATFSDLPTDNWLVVYVEFQRPGQNDIGAGVISIRCRDRTSNIVESPKAPPRGKKKPAAAKRKTRRPTSPRSARKR